MELGGSVENLWKTVLVTDEPNKLSFKKALATPSSQLQ
jgi:formylmethanofuran dehydrogenase subunit A